MQLKPLSKKKLAKSIQAFKKMAKIVRVKRHLRETKKPRRIPVLNQTDNQKKKGKIRG
jgi:hypothetical protein